MVVRRRLRRYVGLNSLVETTADSRILINKGQVSYKGSGITTCPFSRRSTSKVPLYCTKICTYICIANYCMYVRTYVCE